MYLITFLFLISFVLVRFNKDNEIGDYVWSILVRMFLAFVIAGAFISTVILTAPTEIEQYNSTPIYSLKMNDKIQGDFVLFFGNVNNVKYYYYYLQLENGNKQYTETRAESIQIKNTDEIPPQKITYRERYHLPNWIRFLTHKDRNLEGWGDVKYQVLVVPQNAIQQVYDGNIK
jgi:hypothetical protein